MNQNQLFYLRKFLIPFNFLMFGGFFLELFLLVFVVSTLQNPYKWTLLLLGTGSMGVGNLVGFLFSTFGAEDARFGDVFKILNGLLGGFAAADLTQKGGLIRSTLRMFGHATGAGSGTIASIIAAFGSIGFLALYVNRRLIINPAMATFDEMIVESGPSRPKGAQDLPEFGPELVALGQELSKQNKADLLKETSVLRLRSYGKAFYAIEDFDSAIEMLTRAKGLRAHDENTLFYLASCYIKQGQELEGKDKEIAKAKMVEAARVLDELIQLPNAQILAWKLLGYVCLWIPERFVDAQNASARFLTLRPVDAGGLLNLACAQARLTWISGDQNPDPDLQSATLDTIQKLLAISPESKTTIRALLQPGEDFEKWGNNGELVKLIS